MTPSQKSLLARIRNHAEVRGMGDVATAPAETLARARKFMKLEKTLLLRNHRQGMAGIDVAYGRACVMDVLLESLLQNALHGIEKKLKESVSLVALGGYGRGELCPFSDVDIMLLYDAKLPTSDLDAVQARMSERMLYPLWDLKLKVGHSSRTIEESVEIARSDAVTRNALFEARYVAGELRLFDQLTATIESEIQKEGVHDLVDFILAEQIRRHARYGGMVFMQEPEIKNGVGGLRDFHTLRWFSRLLFGGEDIGSLVKRGYLKAAEAKSISTAYSFLLRVRHELHFQSLRASDILDLEKQISVATELRYPGANWAIQVESLMRDYYKAAESIRQAARLVEWRYEQPEAKSSKKTKHTLAETGETLFDGFILKGGVLSAATASVFNQDPVRLLRVFRHSQQYRASIDFPLLRLIREKIDLLTPRVASSSQAIHCFLAILAEAGQVGETLGQMHESKVLGRFLPEFDGLYCLVQREIYHRYTADIHTLLCLRELDAVFSATTPVEKRYRDVLLDTEEPALLYLALLLHDIGKQFGITNHAETGARLSEKILKRLGIKAGARSMVVSLVRQHLDMADFWRKHDLDDPANLDRFAALLSSAQQLRYLHVLTYCDARATAPELWNDYKNTLHSQLFSGTLARFERTETIHSQKTEHRKTMLHREIVEKGLAGEFAGEELDAHFSLVPERYFQQYSAEDICLHIRMVNRLLFTITSAHGSGALVPVINWQNDKKQGVSVVTIVTWDRGGLFYQVAGAFAAAGLNILGGTAINRSDQIASETFHVVDSSGAVVASQELRETFARNLDDALVQQRDLDAPIRAQAERTTRRPVSSREKHLQGAVKPKVSVYQESSLHRTIVEMETVDRIGLLYRLGRVFFQHRLDVTFARVTTERGVAVDTFYLEPFVGEPDKTADELKALRADIGECLRSNLPSGEKK
ncbi:MAG: [protein-PII] uridylyltransferase [Puniceicoccales bacterium]|jgi:[protein-PII] uridylyltransferase|nr:[protein-PII] uridylyltransferase [Puniceicoccales bacterium]